MTLEQMINKLNKYVDNSLGFTRYSNEWEVSSYHDNTLFVLNIRGSTRPKAKTFSGVVKLAYQTMLDDQAKKRKEEKPKIKEEG